MIQIYAGKGKGKTTAAIGLAIRAAGAGLKVFIGQFIKGKKYNEFKILDKIKNIKTELYGRGCFIKEEPQKKDIALAKKGLAKVKKIVLRKKFDLVILDEINIALHCKLIGLKDVVELIKQTPPKTELVLTGRYAHPEVLKLADLVSEIKDKRHYFKKGLKAREGIEF